MAESGSRSTPNGVERPITSGAELTLRVERPAFGGQGVAHHEGFVVFVDGGMPGDLVRVQVGRVRRRYAEAQVTEVIEASPHRVRPRCRHFGPCGGCRWQVLEYAAQLEYKQGQVTECLERLGGLHDFETAPIRGMEHPWRYRNKAEFSVGRDERGNAAVGFHPSGRWDTVLPIEDCLLLPESITEARAVTETWLSDSGLEPWNPRTRAGSARQVTIRHADATGQLLVGLTTTSSPPPQAKDLAERLAVRIPEFVGLVHTQVREGRDLPTHRSSTTMWGKDHLTETVSGLTFDLSIDAFFQTNTLMAPVLYQTIAEAAELSGTDTVWDLYCGTGAIALYLARTAAGVLGIEVVPAAVNNARRNAAQNGLNKAHFLLGDTRRVLKEILEGRLALPPGLSKPDVVILDPPRGGLARKVIARVAAAQPRRVVYVSCNPSTQAGDLALFADAGYRLERVVPVDMFPHTPHIEAVATLSA